MYIAHTGSRARSVAQRCNCPFSRR